MKQAASIREQLLRIMVRHNIKLCSTDFVSKEYSINIRKALLSGYFMRYFLIYFKNLIFFHLLYSFIDLLGLHTTKEEETIKQSKTIK